MPPPLILASQSPRRQELLRQILPDFHVVSSHATELMDPALSPRALCELNAERKAMLVAERYPRHLVLGADTLVFLDDQPLGKPADLDDARRMLRRLAGRVHQVITGVCLVHQEGTRLQLFSEASHVRFRPFEDPVIETYLSQVDVLDKAGSYAIQESGSLLVEAVEGSVSNVIGLPVEALRRALMAWDARKPAPGGPPSRG